MTVSKLPSGRWRAQVWHDGRWVPVATVIGGDRSFATKKDGQRAKRKAQDKLETTRLTAVTVTEFRERWLTDPLFAPPKHATTIYRAEHTKAFAEKYGTVALTDVRDDVVGEWLAGGKRTGTIPALRVMFNAACSAKAGRLITSNPFAGLGITQGRGNRDKQPPSEAMVWDLIREARRVSSPYFAGWLQVACFTGLRPGELDALRWDAIDLDGGWLHVREQFSAATRTFTTPKNGKTRKATLTPPAREALIALPRAGDFCFVTLRGTHWAPSTRAYHWKATKAGAGFDGTLYLATRHFFGWYAINELGLDSEDVAIALGHTDGGQLVRTTYGHREHGRALERVKRAFAPRENVRPMRETRAETA